MKVIGLHGDIGSGKSFVASFVKDNFGFKKLSFADPIRDICKVVFSFSTKQMSDRELKEKVDEFWKLSPRDAFRSIGHGLRSEIDDRIWVNSMHQRILKSPDSSYIIDDVRYQNEADLIIQELNGAVIRVVRPDNPFAHNNTHASDKQQLTLTDDTITIVNDCGKEELLAKVMFTLKDLGVLDKDVFNEMLRKLNARNSWRIGLWRC